MTKKQKKQKKTKDETRCLDGTRVEVIETHNRITSMDGRFIHWVRGHGGGDRYSLVFYSLDPDAATESIHALRDFEPTGNGVMVE